MTSNQEDKIISEFLESIGPWRDFVIIGFQLLRSIATYRAFLHAGGPQMVHRIRSIYRREGHLLQPFRDWSSVRDIFCTQHGTFLHTMHEWL